MGAGGQKSENLQKALGLIDQAVERYAGLDLIVLPEYCNGEPTPSNVEEIAESIPGPFSQAMGVMARSKGVNLVTGSFAEAAADGRAYNTTLVFDRSGKEIGRYRKTHLMEALAFRETAFMAPGDELCLCETDFGCLGVMVCYDMRFPELARTLALGGAEVIAIPAAFPSGELLPPPDGPLGHTDHEHRPLQPLLCGRRQPVRSARQGPSLRTQRHHRPLGNCRGQSPRTRRHHLRRDRPGLCQGHAAAIANPRAAPARALRAGETG